MSAMFDDFEIIEEEAVNAGRRQTGRDVLDDQAPVVGVARVHPDLLGVARVGSNLGRLVRSARDQSRRVPFASRSGTARRRRRSGS